MWEIVRIVLIAAVGAVASLLVERAWRRYRVRKAADERATHPDTGSRRFYHGTRADLKSGDLIQPGYSSNYTERRSPWVYFSETLDAAIWGAELAKGEGSGRIYIVEPNGSFVDDPNLTDKKFPGNPTKSYRSREPLRVVTEHRDWQGHSPDVIQAMKDGIAGLEPIDDWHVEGATVLQHAIPGGWQSSMKILGRRRHYAA